MKTQQDMVREACMSVLNRVPNKGTDAKEAFTPEVRAKLAEYMLARYEHEWVIKSETAKANPRQYIVGNKPTDLLQHWTLAPSTDKKKPAELSPLDVIKVALSIGLITKEQAAAKVLELL